MQRRPLAFGLATLVLAPLAACSKNDEAAPAAAAPARKLSGIEAYAIASKGSGFTMGPVMAANTVYVFFDTTCPHCAELWNASQPLLGKLKMVWMPIGLLRPSSLPQGATILAAADPAKAMTENEASVLQRGGGISVASSLPDEVVAKVKANTDLFRQLDADSVPLIVYRNAQTGQHGMHAGSLDTASLASLAGI
ncbi:MAG TPA: thioredoxin fold domain-containing protein [Piscinibacter sp.]|jgi:thiol:disulfide interchange protein DsbG|uniref:thioredoxin fold domain-containing protein n=1 Tax=Piscinibacter sp. TaxID=1903157 RepID=UPI001B50041D|nr:thioredoxin fold domain-containing protein [Piscinibacter sp.]MBK7533748.1 thioredoxin fold domain-containing protein [Piscinibacter sp.]MBP6541755.1 thioredoxin fold domain-containing protein [Piscinibacter sp.]HOY36689.1 thioredoxin fold domain-containing protein [Piscinibacter sp.]HPG77103.1 thioredoxin fold domain-containing protein [Piscinibacter sp.]HPM68108.1 thioredoxin fold domain-containing protein [Piscinibacter sp.]